MEKENLSVREIDLSAKGNAEFLANVKERHGCKILNAARALSRLFILYSPWAPGVSFCGGKTNPVHVPQLKRDLSFSLGGSAEQLEDAFAACVAEGVERLSQLRHPEDSIVRHSVSGLGARIMPSATRLVNDILGAEHRGAEVEFIEGKLLEDDRKVLLPVDWSLRSYPMGQLTIPGTASSTGVAAGQNFEIAASRALLELVERDAAALWWVGGCRGRPLSLDNPGTVEYARMLSILRGDGTQRTGWLLDITSNLEIPCIASVSFNEDGRGFACGLAARTTWAEAVRAATLELCQMELGLQLVTLKRQQRGIESLNEVEKRQLALSEVIDAHSCALLQPEGAPSNGATSTKADDLAALKEAFQRRGIEAAIVNLTRPAFGIAVASAIAPTLQPLPSTFHSNRLRRIIDIAGGGECWTQGLSLL
jgi:ribosomal protein S12 methylthiotransferase accessory factor